MRRWFVASLIIWLVICAECQEPGDDPTTTRKSTETELFQTESITTTPSDINTTLSSTEIENNSTTSSDDTNNMLEETTDTDARKDDYNSSTREDYLTTRDFDSNRSDDDNWTKRGDDLTTRADDQNDQEEFLSTLTEDEYDETTMSTTENEYLISIKDVFEKSMDVVNEEMRGIGIIQDWLKAEAMAGTDPSTDEYEYTSVTDDYTDTNEAYAEEEKNINNQGKEIVLVDNNVVENSNNGTESTHEAHDDVKEKEGTIVEKIENDLETLNKIEAEEEKEIIERDEVIQDIEKNLNELEAASSKVKETPTTEIFTEENETETENNEEATTPLPEIRDNDGNPTEVLIVSDKIETEANQVDSSTKEGITEDIDSAMATDEIDEEELEEKEKEVITITTEINNIPEQTIIIMENEQNLVNEPIDEKTDIRYNNIHEERSKNNRTDSEEKVKSITEVSGEIAETETTMIIPVTELIKDEEEISENYFNIEENKTTTEVSDTVTEAEEYIDVDSVDDDDVTTTETIILTSEITNKQVVKEETETTSKSTIPTIIPEQENQEEEDSEIEITNEMILTTETFTTTEEELNNEELPSTTQAPTSTTIDSVDKVTTDFKQIDFTLLVIPDGQSKEENKESTEENKTEPSIIKQIGIAGENVIEGIIEEIEEFEDISTITPTSTLTTTENSAKLFLERTLNLTKTINNILKGEDKSIPVKGVSASSEDILIINDNAYNLNTNPSKLPENEAIETIITASEEKLLTSDDIDREGKKILENHNDMDMTEEEDDEDNALEEVDQYEDEKKDVEREMVSRPKVSAQLVDNISGIVCLNASGLQIQITANNRINWVPANAMTFGDCTASGAILNFTWRLGIGENGVKGEKTKNATLSLTFTGDAEESYIEEVNFKSSEGNFHASKLENYLTDPTIISISKDTIITITHPNIKLYHQKQDYATTMVSVDNALALQIASGGLCLFVVVIGVGIYAYRRLRSQARIFKVSLDK